MAKQLRIPDEFADWEYDAEVMRVIDGDTMDVQIDCGFKIHHNIRIRLFGVDTPPIRSKDSELKRKGFECKQFVETATDGGYVKVQTMKTGKYGRYIAVVYYSNPLGIRTCLNQMLVNTGRAKIYYGGKK